MRQEESTSNRRVELIKSETQHRHPGRTNWIENDGIKGRKEAWSVS